MKLLKPSWVRLDGKPIFSVDIHPDGTRFASGGQGEDCGLVVIWNLLPVKNEEDEKDDGVPKVLCQMDNHSGCVNCVRWSTKGAFLATGSDDKCVMVWQSGKMPFSPTTMFGSGGTVSNVEHWRCVYVLRGHSEDVLDVAWSPDDRYLASGSVDNTIIIWDAQNFPASLRVLSGHRGLVKGVAWDPIGKFFASQSDDKTLQIWRTSDWQMETEITEPFAECCGTTHVLRLNWSTDGQYLVSAHAMNKGGPVAKIINRDGWTAKMDFVGHRKAVTCVRFNNRLFTKQASASAATIKQYSCCAIGSKDRSLSVWLTTLKRPLVVLHGLFKSSIMDISWGACGFCLIACSLDGTVAYFEFDAKELGDAMSDEEKFVYHKQAHGTNIKTGKSTFSSAFIENPDILKIQQSSIKGGSPSNGLSTPKSSKMTKKPVDIIPAKSHAQNDHVGSKQLCFTTATPDQRVAAMAILKKQKETVTEDGKRRITPLSLSSLSGQLERKTVPPPDVRDSEGHSSSNVIVATSTTTLSKSIPAAKSVSSAATVLSVKRRIDLPDGTEKKRGRKEKDKWKDKSDKTETAKKQDDDKRTAPDGEVRLAAPAHLWFIPHPKPEDKLYLKIPEEKFGSFGEVSIETENNLLNVSAGQFLRCTRADTVYWEVSLSSPITVVSGSRKMVCAACSDKTVHVFSRKGSRLLPPMAMESHVSFLHCNDAHAMVIVSSGFVFVWDVVNQVALIKLESIMPVLADQSVSVTRTILTDCGHPVVSLSDHTSFSFSPSLNVWVPLTPSVSTAQVATELSRSNSPPAGQNILQSIQAPSLNFSRQAGATLRLGSSKQQSITLSYLQNQLFAAKEVGSSDEYRHWLRAYTRHVVHSGQEPLLREICNDLLGPVHTLSKCGTSWNDTVLSFKKRALLQDLLSIIATNLRFQRLYVEYKDLLDRVKF